LNPLNYLPSRSYSAGRPRVGKDSAVRICKTCFPKIRTVAKLAIFNKYVAASQKRCKVKPSLLLIPNTHIIHVHDFEWYQSKRPWMSVYGRPLGTLLYKICLCFGAHRENAISGKSCNPVTVVAGSSGFLQIFAGVLWKGASN